VYNEERSQTSTSRAETISARVFRNPIDNFPKNGYSVFRRLVGGPALTFLHDYAVKTARLGVLRDGDSDVPCTPCRYGDPLMDALLEALLPQFEEATGKKLHPTYSYFRVYKRGDVLKRHRDRPACEMSVTLGLGYGGSGPWPIWIEPDRVPTPILLGPGDGLLYKGVDTTHWREPFSGEYAAQVFLHYVDQEGPFQEHLYDGRASLAATPATRRIVNGFMLRQKVGA
jgi:hypothetical protein